MAIRTIKSLAPAWFTPRSQKGVEDPAEFKVRGLTGHQQALVGTEVTITERGDLQFSAKGILLILRFGLLDWRNVNDDDDNPVEFAGHTPRQIQDMLHYNDQVALAAQIFNQSFLNIEDKKKS